MIEGLIAIALALVSYIIAGIVWGSAITVKVDTLWAFLLQRGKVEAIEKGYGKLNSPFTINPDIKDWLLGLAITKEIAQYCYNNSFKTEYDKAYAIERKFGERLVSEICVPKNVNKGACLVMILEALRKERRILNFGRYPERRYSK